MGVHVHCSGVRYAVIGASSNKPERLVIAYQDENCLRDLIAAPSIIGVGFASREEAMANLEGLTHSERLI
jgi:glutamate synthase domain-containing protein 1